MGSQSAWQPTGTVLTAQYKTAAHQICLCRPPAECSNEVHMDKLENCWKIFLGICFVIKFLFEEKKPLHSSLTIYPNFGNILEVAKTGNCLF